MGHGHQVTHRNTELPQPEICQLTGTMVAAQDLIVSDVEGLRGVHVGSSYPWQAQIRMRPSYNDIRRLNPGPPLTASQQKYLSGSKLWYQGIEISEREFCIIPDENGELFTFPGGKAGRRIASETPEDLLTEGGDFIVEDEP